MGQNKANKITTDSISLKLLSYRAIYLKTYYYMVEISFFCHRLLIQHKGINWTGWVPLMLCHFASLCRTRLVFDHLHNSTQLQFAHLKHINKNEDSGKVHSVPLGPAHPHRCLQLWELVRPLVRVKLGGAMQAFV